jgi:hypothetical protein
LASFSDSISNLFRQNLAQAVVARHIERVRDAIDQLQIGVCERQPSTQVLIVERCHFRCVLSPVDYQRFNGHSALSADPLKPRLKILSTRDATRPCGVSSAQSMSFSFRISYFFQF